jgi:putative DNA primase/helicase
MKTTQAAIGKWRGILKHFGLPEESLRNVHQPCPLCGGSDRYRFDDKDGTGSYYCSGCGAGDGLSLLMKFTGMDFKEAARSVDKIVGNIRPETQASRSNAGERFKRILNGCRPITKDDAAGMYLLSRGLPASRSLMFNPSVNYYENGEKLGCYPAMVAVMHNASGEQCMLHVTHLNHDGTKADVKSVKKYTGSISSTDGAHIRLTSVHQRIGIAEGIETALAVMRLFKIPCWASGSANFMETFKAPKGVEFVTVFADNDSNYRGQAAAYTLANRLTTMQGRICVVEMPREVGDYADVLLSNQNNLSKPVH